MLRWRIELQEYTGNMIIIHKEGKSHTYSDGLSRCPLDDFKRNPAYDTEIASKNPIHFIEIDRKKNFSFFEWEPGSGTPETNYSGPEETEDPILGISSSELHNQFFQFSY
ncbi:hypothetical protein O181_006509 [Austropuccinia psidii MF-1]|uniref:Uncharacterized protein n=1 Tax=Austropuccinia psidii MF-1 TaxID=1389203 RepID=A0A9Q3GGY5_9BASI|nr:hypothetical protein [Austropuccinia psidii MF-1]